MKNIIFTIIFLSSTFVIQTRLQAANIKTRTHLDDNQRHSEVLLQAAKQRATKPSEVQASLRLAEAALSAGADIEYRDPFLKRSPLVEALDFGHEAMAIFLVQCGAQLKDETRDWGNCTVETYMNLQRNKDLSEILKRIHKKRIEYLKILQASLVNPQELEKLFSPQLLEKRQEAKYDDSDDEEENLS